MPRAQNPADPPVSDHLLGGEPTPCQELNEPKRLEAVDAEPVRQLRAGEHAAMQARQRDPFGAVARQAVALQRLLASLQMVDQRDSPWVGSRASRFMGVPAPQQDGFRGGYSVLVKVHCQ